MKIQSALKKLIAGSAIALGVSMVGQPAEAATTQATLLIQATVSATCNVSATGINFGPYDVTAVAATDNSGGSVTVDCTNGAPYTVGIDNGLHFSGTRRLANGTNFLGYYLSSVPYLALPTDTGTNITGYIGTGTGLGVPGQVTTAIYGRIPPGVAVPSGTYTDTVTALVTY